MSIIWRTRWHGSKLSPIVSPHCSRIRRHIRGRRGDVVAARPLVVAEQHRAVLERDLPPVVLREADDVRPDAERLLPVLVLVLRPVAAHERVHERDVHLLGGVDHLLEVADDLRAVLRVGVERVGVEAEAGDRRGPWPRSRRRSPSPARRTGWRRRCGSCPRSGGSGRSRVGQQAISRTSKPAPAAQSATSMQRRLGERGGQEAELHRGCSSAVARRGHRVARRRHVRPRPSAGARALERPRRRPASPRGRRRRSRSAAWSDGRPARTSS